MSDKFKLGDKVDARTTRRPAGFAGIGLDGYWEITCRDKDGNVKWTDVIHNIVTNEGLNYVLDVVFSDGTQDSTHYIGLTDGAPLNEAAGDTLASKSWSEVTAYDEATRVAWAEDGPSSQSITNSSTATFTISADSTTVGGAFLTVSSTKGSTSSGAGNELICVGEFASGDKSLDDNDTLDVTLTITASDA